MSVLQAPLQTLPPPAASYSQITPFPHSARQTRSQPALQMPSARGQRTVQRDRPRAADQSPSPQTQPAAVVLRTPALQQVGRTRMFAVVAEQVGLRTRMRLVVVEWFAGRRKGMWVGWMWSLWQW